MTAPTKPPFRYILRYLIDPHFHREERIRELVDFCKASGIEEVMMFITAEELSAGHPTGPELDDYIELGKALKEQLSREAIDLSLNPWSTTYHNGRGRSLRGGQEFRLMVGENGVENVITACPLCENWRSYLSGSFARMASEIQPVALWIEDDWRLKNHDRSLGWGGCFCKEHLRRFSLKVGTNVSREELLEAILAPGAPHPWRSAWLDLSKETLLEPLGMLSAAIRRASPQTRVALMSSNPDAHAAEGRNWAEFQRAAGNEPAFMSRPNMGPYTQSHALSSPPSTTRLTVANLRGAIEIYPELENSPRCGAYSKSRAYSLWQIFHAAAIGASGITINHYDMLGNGISLDEPYGCGLAQAKPRLDALRALEIDDRRAQGVQVLFSPEISRHIETHGHKEGMAALSQSSGTWSTTCFILGISHRFSSGVHEGTGPVLVNEQTLRAFNDDDVRTLLSGSLIVDATSVEILVERGFGSEIGVRSASRQSLKETGYAYEQIEAEGFGTERLPLPRMSAQRCSPWLLKMEASPGAEALSTIRNAVHQTLWPASLCHENSLGGRTLCLSYPVNGKAQFFMSFFNVYRKRFLQQLLFGRFSSPHLACLDHPALHAYRAPTKDGTVLAALNPTDDRVDSVDWLVPFRAFDGEHWLALRTDGSWRPIEPSRERRRHGDLLRFPHGIAPLEGAFFHSQKA